MENDYAQTRPYERGFHPIYLWGAAYVLFTYAYPFLGAFVTSWENDLGSVLSLVCLGIPLILLVVNIIIAIKERNTLDRRYFFNTALLIKYAMIPFFLVGGCLILLMGLLTFTPVVIMIFVGPMAVAILSAMGWISMVGSAPLTIAYLNRSLKDKKNGKLFAVIIGIMQFFFGLDVLGIIISAFKERRFIKLTICVFAALVLLFVGIVVWIVWQILAA